MIMLASVTPINLKNKIKKVKKGAWAVNIFLDFCIFKIDFILLRHWFKVWLVICLTLIKVIFSLSFWRRCCIFFWVVVLPLRILKPFCTLIFFCNLLSLSSVLKFCADVSSRGLSPSSSSSFLFARPLIGIFNLTTHALQLSEIRVYCFGNGLALFSLRNFKIWMLLVHLLNESSNFMMTFHLFYFLKYFLIYLL